MTGEVLTVSALTFNAHLFGRTAEFFVGGSRRETGFYFHDAERLPQIVSAVECLDADFVGLTEIWDEDDGRRIQEALSSRYPYAVAAPAAPGLGRVIEKTYAEWPRLASRIFGRGAAGDDGYVSLFTRRHYSAAKTGLATGSSPYVTEDRIGRALSTVLRSGPVWGSGLLFLSKYPITATFFLPHSLRADWEHLAAKGVLWSTVKMPRGDLIRVSLGHYQEGTSPEARAARKDQIRKTSRTIGFLGGSVLSMGDFNVIGETLEYAWMMSTLALIDSGSEPTYRDPNPYQQKLRGHKKEDAMARRLDYILHSADWRVLESAVPRDEFWAKGSGFHLSDHDPVLTRLALIHDRPS